MNSPKVKDAMDAVFEEMMSWPPWYFRFRLWWHWHFGKRHWIMKVLQETGYFKRLAESKRKPPAARAGEKQEGKRG